MNEPYMDINLLLNLFLKCILRITSYVVEKRVSHEILKYTWVNMMKNSLKK